MTDREIFQYNLTYYLEASGKSQRQLADYVGVKKSTVSGWVHGASYPRADTMEKISMFFGLLLSDLVMERDHQDAEEARLLRAFRRADPKYRELAMELLEEHPLKKDVSAQSAG